MVKTGGNIDAIPMGGNSYKLIDGRIVTHNELWQMERNSLKRKELSVDNIKRKAIKKLREHCEKMVIVGYSENYVVNFFQNKKKDIENF